MSAGSIHQGIKILDQTRSSFSSKLHAFASSPADFLLLRHTPASNPPLPTSGTNTLYILDSSFNPPSLAHRHIALEALTNEPDTPGPKRLLLLLATQNADKGTKPAQFEDRLIMMCLFAQDLHAELQKRAAASNLERVCDEAEEDDKPSSLLPAIDIGITKKPYFNDKALAIENANVYPRSAQQVFLTGFDTLLRILDTKYYAPEHTLARLEPFLSRNRIRVTYRPDDSWGSKEEQDAYLARLANGGMEELGGKKDWAKKIQFVEGTAEGEEVVSSTKAREAAIAEDPAALDKFVSSEIKIWIKVKGLYD